MSKRGANPYFRFQQFTVFHDQCAMKVGTDGVLLGAWANVDAADAALDIGTGTGLIALMLAQRNEALQIDAIDIDEGAVGQARENVGNSPFSGRIEVKQSAIQVYNPAKKYDVIVSNPPYFAETVRSPDVKRLLARSNESLPVEYLFSLATKLMTDRGRISLIYPSNYREKLVMLASENQLCITRITNVLPTPQSEPKRILIELSKEEKGLEENDLIIEMGRHLYSEGFKKLVEGFYLCI